MQRDEKIGLGCATLIMAILLCMFVFGPHPARTLNMPQAAGVASTATQVATPTMQATETPTPTPVPPTPTPVPPTPTPIPPTPTPVVQPTPTTPPVISQTPTQLPTPQLTQQPTVTYNTNPTGGSKVYNPPADFCTSHSCVSTFWKDTSGYVVECVNGVYSHSGGVNGACSQDGGVAATLYQHN